MVDGTVTGDALNTVVCDVNASAVVPYSTLKKTESSSGSTPPLQVKAGERVTPVAFIAGDEIEIADGGRL